MGPDAAARSPVQVRTCQRRDGSIIEDAYRQNPLAPSARAKKRGPQKKSKPRNLLERLDKHRSQIQAFLTDCRVPFANNQAERAIRMRKVPQKIAGLFRSEDGAEVFCRLRRDSFTARKNAGDVGACGHRAVRWAEGASPESEPPSGLGGPLWCIAPEVIGVRDGREST